MENGRVKYRMLLVFVAVMASVSACASFLGIPGGYYDPSQITITEPRVLVLDGTKYTEKDVGGFIFWPCRDFVYEGSVLVEVGYFGSPDFAGIGFVLYDGGDSGELANYSRVGLRHRWDWGPNGNDYALVIESDGTGLYYDFTFAKTTKASEIFKCTRQ